MSLYLVDLLTVIAYRLFGCGDVVAMHVSA
jgi:hypothetical protein